MIEAITFQNDFLKLHKIKTQSLPCTYTIIIIINFKAGTSSVCVVANI